ncbi:hypothetical protein MA4S0726RB_4202 [Mycobacteroides abscessus 4S-0726-RB]|nr:hypothetical protein MA4S0303_4672 [Mycobacteroides abscessus 4S-0303]EIT92866.1 hypothetical protein MA4S0726RB_4202 [Mycobacteroides abscessus 4S-0726-RB]EIT96411.1 hypothetical protein MA4S0726RA_4608 [Mycobacteroides abscessus 4S-0726-RA]EIV60845.1 hypothetical protein MA4S0116S_3747 [Mycobacteroides abscessus 4S-0116-S]
MYIEACCGLNVDAPDGKLLSRVGAYERGERLVRALFFSDLRVSRQVEAPAR